MTSGGGWPAETYRNVLRSRREHADQERHQLTLAEVTVELIGPKEDVEGRPAHQRVRAEGVPHLPHQRRRRQAVAGHVADHQDDVALGPDERVEPVAAHADRGGGRQVPRREAQSRQERKDLREERPLERLDHDAGTVREANAERERHPVGDELEELGLVLREAPARLRPDVHHADQVAVREQRHAEEGTDPLLEQDRVQDGAVIDLVEGDRLPLGGDATGEPFAHGDADAAFHLLLDALGGPGHELVPRLVQQEDGGRVDVEDLADPFEQLVQEVVDGEVGKGGVADALDPLQKFQRLDRGRPPVPHPSTVRPGSFEQQPPE